MIRKKITEHIEIIDLENKVNNNVYERKYSLFGITFYRATYNLTNTINENKDVNTPIGFNAGNK